MFNFEAYLNKNTGLIEQSLRSHVEATFTPGRLKKAVLHSLMAGGKRLRPILCIASCEATGGTIEDSLHVACAIEMIHTYSLIHDDLPAMDNDDLRRGQPTCHKQFDEATAILAGDALLTAAFEILADHSDAPGQTSADIIRVIARASGARGMIQGQMLDILSEGKHLSLQDMEALHRLKTGALIQASVVSGSKCHCQAQPDAERKLATYAGYTGLAFQVIDDILNIEGDATVMGKATGTDQDLNKATYPGHMGISESKKFAQDLVTKAIDAISELSHTEPLQAIARYTIERKL